MGTGLRVEEINKDMPKDQVSKLTANIAMGVSSILQYHLPTIVYQLNFQLPTTQVPGSYCKQFLDLDPFSVLTTSP